MNVPSGVRSAVYMLVPVAFVTVTAPSTNPVIITCAIGLCIGAGILVSRNVDAHTESDTPTPINLSSFSHEGREANSYTDVVATAGQWTNYPSTPTTGTHPERYEPEPPPDRSWLKTELIGGRKMSPGGYKPHSAQPIRLR